jgi:hypothetical protein
MPARNVSYPDTYGKAQKGALPDILGPLNIEAEGDALVPQNDMAEIAGAMCSGEGSPDPLDIVYLIETDGTKEGGKSRR